MARDHLVRIAHGGQVIGLVPLDQQRQVGQQQSLLAVVQGNAELPGPAYEFFRMGFTDQTHQALCSSC